MKTFDRQTDRQMDGWTSERVLVRMKTFGVQICTE
jgi:hypothetical protein